MPIKLQLEGRNVYINTTFAFWTSQICVEYLMIPVLIFILFRRNQTLQFRWWETGPEISGGRVQWPGGQLSRQRERKLLRREHLRLSVPEKQTQRRLTGRVTAGRLGGKEPEEADCFH